MHVAASLALTMHDSVRVLGFGTTCSVLRSRPFGNPLSDHMPLTAVHGQFRSGMPDAGDRLLQGHAIECRINAEDPFKNFRPGPGRVMGYLAPGGPHVRMDSHLYPDYLVRHLSLPRLESCEPRVVLHSLACTCDCIGALPQRSTGARAGPMCAPVMLSLLSRCLAAAKPPHAFQVHASVKRDSLLGKLVECPEDRSLTI